MTCLAGREIVDLLKVELLRQPVSTRPNNVVVIEMEQVLTKGAQASERLPAPWIFRQSFVIAVHSLMFRFRLEG